MPYVIRTIPSENIKTLYYNGCGAPEWQPGFPEIYSSREQADKDLSMLLKKWANIEIVYIESK